MKQGDPEWFAARLGRATASYAADILAKGKSGEAATRRQYRARLCVERLTGTPQESYQNQHMLNGNEREPYGRITYEAATGYIVDEIGFIPHPAMMAGCSPDGLIDDDGLCEFKCVTPAVHVETLFSGKPPTEHLKQINFQLWITGREWCDFVSYQPAFPRELQLGIWRVSRDDTYIATLEKEVIKFLAEVDEMTDKLRNLHKQREAA